MSTLRPNTIKQPARHINNELLVSAMSAICNSFINGVSSQPGTGNISLFHDHRLTYSYGRVGGSDTSQWRAGGYTIYVKHLTGKITTCQTNPNTQIRALKSYIENQERLPVNQQRLIFAGKQLEDGRTLAEYNIVDHATLQLVLRLRGGDQEILDIGSLDSRYDYDFTNIDDRNESHSRGGETYTRPCGWMRIAIRVLGRFENEVWLGHLNRPGEWPVSYHGTAHHQGKSIADTGYDITRGRQFPLQYGVYTTPNIHLAERFATQFTYRGEPYIILLQNRVNPANLQKISNNVNGIEEYWISPSEDDVRPYGICIRKL